MDFTERIKRMFAHLNDAQLLAIGLEELTRPFTEASQLGRTREEQITLAKMYRYEAIRRGLIKE
jgi:hypothetical protein